MPRAAGGESSRMVGGGTNLNVQMIVNLEFNSDPLQIRSRLAGHLADDVADPKLPGLPSELADFHGIFLSRE